MPRRKVKVCVRGHRSTPDSRYKDGSCKACQRARAAERRAKGIATKRNQPKKRLAELERAERERMEREARRRRARLELVLGDDPAVRRCREERAKRCAPNLTPTLLAEVRRLMTAPRSHKRGEQRKEA